MAHIGEQINGQDFNALQIKIFTTAQTTAPSAAPGIISFDQVSQRVGINGVWYGSSQSDYSAITSKLQTVLDSLEANHLIGVSESENVKTYSIGTDQIGDLSGTTVTLDNGSLKTVRTLTDSLQAQINAITGGTDSNLNTVISNAINNAINGLGPTSIAGGATGVTGTAQHVKVEVTTQSGNVTTVTVNEDDIASATGLAALETTVSGVKQTADSAIQSVSLKGTNNTEILTKSGTSVTGSIDGSKIAVGGTGTHSGTTVAGAVEDIYSQIGTTASGAELHLYSGETGTTEATSVTADGNVYRLVQGTDEIARFNIEKDSFVKSGSVVVCGDGTNNTVVVPNGVDGDRYIHLVINTHDAQSGATGEDNIYIPVESLIDSYTSGSTGTDVVQISVDNTTNKISATFGISEVTGSSTQVQGFTGTATSGSTIDIIDQVTVVTENGSVKSVSTSTGISVDAPGAAAAAKSEVIGSSNDGTGASTVYGAKAYADAKDTALSETLIGTSTDTATADTIYGAKAAATAAAAEAAKHTTVTGASGTGSSNQYIVVTDGAQTGEGHAYTVKTTTALDDAITAAETGAVATAKTYTDQVITWTIVS